MKRVLILLGVVLTISLTTTIIYAYSNPAETYSHSKFTCVICKGKACPKATKSGVCNCTVFYRCPNDKCSLTVCDGCYYKYILPNLNKGCPGCNGHNQFKQVH